MICDNRVNWDKVDLALSEIRVGINKLERNQQTCFMKCDKMSEVIAR